MDNRIGSKYRMITLAEYDDLASESKALGQWNGDKILEFIRVRMFLNDPYRELREAQERGELLLYNPNWIFDDVAPEWVPISPLSFDLPVSCYSVVKPVDKVKKWRWIMQVGENGFEITDGYYTEEVAKDLFFIQRVDESEIEE